MPASTARRTQGQIRALLRAPQAGEVISGFVHLEANRSEPECAALIAELGDGTTIDALGRLRAGAELRRCVRAPHHTLATLWTLRVLGALQQARTLTFRGLPDVDVLSAASSLTELNLAGCDVLENVDGLAGLTQLRALDLHGCTRLQNINGLSDMTSLRRLNLLACDSLQDVDGLAGLTGLTQLYLQGSGIRNVDGLAGSSWTSLDLTGCIQLEDVGGLADMATLRALSLNGNSLPRLDALATLTGLETLDAGFSCALVDTTGLAGLPNLTRLSFADSPRLARVSGLEDLPRLTELDLSRCPALSRIDALPALSTLKVMGDHALQESALHATLAQLPTLQRLHLQFGHGTARSDLTVLPPMPGLLELTLETSQPWRSLSALAELPALRSLSLACSTSTLPDLSAVAHLSALESFSLRFVSDLSLAQLQPLLGLHQLSRVDLTDTALPPHQCRDFNIPQLLFPLLAWIREAVP